MIKKGELFRLRISRTVRDFPIAHATPEERKVIREALLFAYRHIPTVVINYVHSFTVHDDNSDGHFDKKVPNVAGHYSYVSEDGHVAGDICLLRANGITLGITWHEIGHAFAMDLARTPKLVSTIPLFASLLGDVFGVNRYDATATLPDGLPSPYASWSPEEAVCEWLRYIYRALYFRIDEAASNDSGNPILRIDKRNPVYGKILHWFLRNSAITGAEFYRLRLFFFESIDPL